MARKTKLQLTFEEFNHKYFDDRLYDVEVKWSKGKKLTIEGEVVCGYAYSPADITKPQLIVLDRKLRRKEWIWKLVLLHEMNHMDLHSYDEEVEEHGPEFHEGMLRLAKAGALIGIW